MKTLLDALSNQKSGGSGGRAAGAGCWTGSCSVACDRFSPRQRLHFCTALVISLTSPVHVLAFLHPGCGAGRVRRQSGAGGSGCGVGGDAALGYNECRRRPASWKGSVANWASALALAHLAAAGAAPLPLAGGQAAATSCVKRAARPWRVANGSESPRRPAVCALQMTWQGLHGPVCI